MAPKSKTPCVSDSSGNHNESMDQANDTDSKKNPNKKTYSDFQVEQAPNSLMEQEAKKANTIFKTKAQPVRPLNPGTSVQKPPSGKKVSSFLQHFNILTPEQKKEKQEREAKILEERRQVLYKKDLSIRPERLSEQASIYSVILNKKWNQPPPGTKKTEAKPSHLLMDGGMLIRGVSMQDLDMAANPTMASDSKNVLQSRYTHFYGPGGKLYVPDESLHLFHNALIVDINENKRFFVIENATPTFKMCMDMDYKGSSQVTLEEMIEHAKLLQQEAKLFYPEAMKPKRQEFPLGSDPKFDIVVCSVDPEIVPERIHHSIVTRQDTEEFEKNKDKQAALESRVPTSKKAPKIKSAAHFIFPRLFVEQHEALAIRESFVAALKLKYGQRNVEKGDNIWEDVADEQVLAGNFSLRMVGSHKCEKCKDCHGTGYALESKKIGDVEIKVPCDNCQNMGKVDIGRQYTLQAYIDGQGNLLPEKVDEVMRDMKLPEPKGLLYEYTSIRAHPNQHCLGFTMYSGAPKYIRPENGSDYYEARKKTHLRRMAGLAEDERHFYSLLKKDTNRVVFTAITEKERTMIDNLLQMLRDFNQVYKQLQIKDIILLPSKGTKGTAIINVCGKGSSTCLNLGGDHNNATIYFEVDLHSSILKNKCHCHCSNIRPSGVMCKNYSSKNKVYVDSALISVFMARIFGINTTNLNTMVPMAGSFLRSCQTVPTEKEKEREKYKSMQTTSIEAIQSLGFSFTNTKVPFILPVEQDDPFFEFSSNLKQTENKTVASSDPESTETGFCEFRF